MVERAKELWGNPPIGALEIVLALSIIVWGAWWFVPTHDFPESSPSFRALLVLGGENLWASAGLLFGIVYLTAYFIPRPLIRYTMLIIGAGVAIFVWTYNAAAFALYSPSTVAAPLCTVLAFGSMWTLSRRVSYLVAELYGEREKRRANGVDP